MRLNDRLATAADAALTAASIRGSLQPDFHRRTLWVKSRHTSSDTGADPLFHSHLAAHSSHSATVAQPMVAAPHFRGLGAVAESGLLGAVANVALAAGAKAMAQAYVQQANRPGTDIPVPGRVPELDMALDTVASTLLEAAPRTRALYMGTLAHHHACEMAEVEIAPRALSALFEDAASTSNSVSSLIAPAPDDVYRLRASSEVAHTCLGEYSLLQPLALPRRGDVVPEARMLPADPDLVLLVSHRPRFKRVWSEGREVRSKYAVGVDPIDGL